MEPKDRIIVALDVNTQGEVQRIVSELAPYVGCFKIGLELLMSVGPTVVTDEIYHAGGRVFLDGKFCDIPNTVGKASKAVAKLGVDMFNVHASCGINAMKAAVDNKGDAKVLAVTVLTSIDDKVSERIFGVPAEERVYSLVKDAVKASVDGVICSAKDLKHTLTYLHLVNNEMKIVTPGIRPKWAAKDDQARITTPADAIEAGATHLVIGRPITQPPEEIGGSTIAAQKIADEIASAL